MRESRFFFLGCLLILTAPGWAAPKGASVHSGHAQVRPSSSSVTEIQTSDRVVINWREFSIQAGEKVRFIQPGSRSAVLNRVVGPEVSAITGMLEANGKVYLVNPNGVVIHKGAVIRSAGFVASTLDVCDEEFLQFGPMQFRGDSLAEVVNYGTIQGYEGDVLLLGRYVRNEGTLEAPSGVVGMAVGQQILLKPEGEERLFIVPNRQESSLETGVENSGTIAAIAAELKADGNAYKLAIQQKGIVEATGTEVHNGRILLVADGGVNQTGGRLTAHNADGSGGRVELLGKKVGLVEGAEIDVSGTTSGGAVFIGGGLGGKDPLLPHAELTVVEQGTKIHASSLDTGDGGVIVTWSDQTTHFQGEADARGGPHGGDGGLIEVSSFGQLQYSGFADTRSPLGTIGQLLLDPTDVFINSNPDSNATFGSGTYTYSASPATINTTNLVTNLGTTSVTITTTGDNGGSGDISLSSAVSWTSANSLTLQATRDILITSSLINTSGGGGLTLTAGRDLSIDSSTGVIATAIAGPVTINVGRNMAVDAVGNALTFSATTGALSVNVTGDLEVSGGPGGVPAIFSTPTSGATFSVGGDLSILGQSSNNSSAFLGAITAGSHPLTLNVGGDLLLQGGSGLSTYAQIGQLTDGTGGVLASDMTLNIAGDITLTAGSGANAYVQIGHLINQANPTCSINGDITITTDGNINLTGGAGLVSSAIIGHGNGEFDTSYTIQGDISIIQRLDPLQTGPGIVLTGGSGVFGASAIIGFEFASGVGFSSVDSSGITIDTNGAVQLTGGTGTLLPNNAVIGSYQALSSHSGQINIGTIDVKTTKTVTLTPGVGTGTGGGVAVIGTLIYPALGNSSTSSILVDAAEISVQAATGSSVGKARIINNIVGVSDIREITLQAGNIFVGSNSGVSGSAEIYSSGPLTLIADEDIQLLNGSYVHDGQSALTLVTDNAFPHAPEIGTGKFILTSGGQLTAGGPLRIFTASRSLNQIGATLNGVTFIAGPIYVDSSTEQWGSYYPSSFGGNPYTLFYKQEMPAFYAPYTRSVFENLYDLKTYNDLLFNSRCFLIGFDEQLDEADGLYRMIQPYYRNYETKKFETLD